MCFSGLSNTALQNVSNASMECGTYEQLGYWPNNFDDFAVSNRHLQNAFEVGGANSCHCARSVAE